MKRLGLALALLVGSMAAAQAGPLDPKQIPEGAKWLAHLDVDAMRESLVVRKAYDLGMEKCPPMTHAFNVAQGLLGMDPRKDLHGISAYGPQPGKPEGILIIQVDLDQASLVEKAKTAPGYQAGKHGEYDLHSWNHAKGRATGALVKPNLVVIGQNEAQVGQALDVLEGKAANAQAKLGEALAKEVPAGAILLAWVEGLAESRLPKSPILRQSEAFGLVVGEHQGQSFAKVGVVAKSPEIAARMQKVAEGLKATAELAAAERPELKTIVESAKITLEDHVVKLEAQAPAETVWTLAVKAAKHLEKHLKHRHK